MHEPTPEIAEQVKLKLVAPDSPDAGMQTNPAAGAPEGKKSETAPPEPGTSCSAADAVCKQSSATAGAGTSSDPGGATQKSPASSPHPAALHQILADPGASEEEWLAACYEMEKHPNYQTLDRKRSSASGDIKRLLQTLTVLFLIGLSAVIVTNNFTNHRPAPIPTPPPPQVVPAADVDFGPFMANLQRQIKHNWYPPKGELSSKSMAQFKVARNGDVSYIQITQSGASEAYDRAAMDAIRNASKGFGPLPEGSPATVDIQFTFDYNVFSKGRPF
jgi:TonB family protein